jgi:HAD superfamily hydrolase (TIGR01509 family)
MNIKALIFDVGGVLLRTEDLAPRQKWATRLNVAGPWQLADAVFESVAAVSATSGQATEAAVWAEAQNRFNLNDADLAEFRQDFFAGDRFDERLLDWITIRRTRYHTAILSNAWDNARTFLTSQPKIVAAFDLLVISAEEKAAKPNVTIYQRTLERLGVSPSESIFVDDNAANIAAARQLGLNVIRYRVGLDIVGALARLGVD